MKTSIIVTAAAAALFGAAVAHAQEAVVAPALQPASGGRVLAGAVESRVTPDRPYAAEAVTETVQVLADGNRITRTMKTMVYRDSAGRTRRENFADTDAPVMIAIYDPVAHVTYTLEPHRKTAFRTEVSIVTPVMAAGRGGTGSGRGTGVGAGTGRGVGVAVAPTPLPRTDPGATVLPPPPPAPPQGGGMLVRAQAPGHQNVRTEDLGTQNIEGVLATGTRTTTIIPAGQIGNSREITIVSERWFSDELQVLVLTRHSDPRSGETTYRLRNILRAEPDPSLFTVPPDYTVQDRRIRQPE